MYQIPNGSNQISIYMRYPLINTMSCTYTNSKIVYTSLFYKNLGFLRIGIWIVVATIQIVFLAANLAQLA